MEERRGFVQLTGEIGTGKTMMLDALVLGLDARTKVARLSHTTISTDELFVLIFSEFGIEPVEGGRLAQIKEIQRFLDEWTAAGRNAVLVVDEAQNLSPPVLEEIRLLSNLRSKGLCSLQIVLAGQPEFRDKLDQPELRQLKQRIGIRYHLTPLSGSETQEYIAHRLKVAGANGTQIFDRGAMEAIYAYAGGVPRMINIVCDRALVAGYGSNKKRVGKGLIEETLSDIEGAVPAADVPVRAEKHEPEPVREPPPVDIEIVEAPERDQATEARRTSAAMSPKPEPVPERRPEERTAHDQELKPVRFEREPETGPASGDARPASAPPVKRRRPARRKRRAAPKPVQRGAVVGASADNGRMPSWVLPTVVSVAALVVVVYSAIQTGWWRAMSDVRNPEPVATTEPLVGTDESAEPAVTMDETIDVALAGDSIGEDEAATDNAADRPNAGGTGEVSASAAGSTDDERPESEPVATEVAAAETPETGAVTISEPAGDSAPLDRSAGGTDAPTIQGPGGPFRVIALSSRGADAAADVVDELAEDDYFAEVLPVDIGDGDVWFRVAVVGGYQTLQEARDVAGVLKGIGYDRAWVHKE